ncbi:hypothetical protein ABPG72_013390 [Tetrahymena utriculariae]
MKLNKIIISLFIINYYAISELYNHFDIDQIDNCIEYTYAPSRFSQYLYDQTLCIQCELGYVVSKNYKQCIHFMFQLSYLKYGNCKRLADDGKCAEALDGIQLLPNNLYIIVQDQKFFERCAIIDESESQCLFPRFGFILDRYTNNIFKDSHMAFCALFNSQQNICIKFQQRFLSFFQNQCYSECPRFTKLIDGEHNRICQQFCLYQNSYPVFDDEGVFESCEYNLHSQNSKFCEQNLVNLNKYINLEMKSIQLNGCDQSITIAINFSQTPKDCYEFYLKINPRKADDVLNLEFKDFKVENYNNFQLILQSEIIISELQQRDINICKQNICILFVQIKHKGILKKTIVLKVNLKSEVIVIQSISQNNLNSIQQIEAEKNKLQNYQILNSFRSVNCEDFIVCNSKQIISYPSISLIFDIQVLFDNINLIKQQFVLMPIKAYIIQLDSKLIPVDDFFYVNFYPSKLKIEINFSENTQGQLFQLIKAKDWKDYLLGYQYLINKNKQSYYFVQSIDINIQSKKNSTDNQKVDQNQDQTIQAYKILFLFNAIVCVLMIILVIFIFRRKNIINTTAYQQQNDEQESHRIQQNSSQFHSQENRIQQQISHKEFFGPI